MKGVKYNYQIITPPNQEDIIVHNATMKEACENIIKVFKEIYYINIKCNNQILYNIMARPHTANKILGEKLNMTRV
tara:strand:- start:1597 stop:1824 length:228 start_codon:yes stop_codon:yes gene_type:complete